MKKNFIYLSQNICSLLERKMLKKRNKHGDFRQKKEKKK